MNINVCTEVTINDTRDMTCIELLYIRYARALLSGTDLPEIIYCQWLRGE